MRRRYASAVLVSATALCASLTLSVPSAAAAPTQVGIAQSPSLRGAASAGTAGTAAPAATRRVATASSAQAARVSLDPRCRTGRVICVSKRTRKVHWVVNGTIRLSMDARFGARRTPTREGSFRVFRKSRNHVSNQFGSRMPFSLFFSGGQAVHYSSDFARVGYRGASHGCVNTRNWAKMRTLFDLARVGDRVVVHR